MFVLFEEAGKYLGGRVLSEAEASAQVELDTGKRLAMDRVTAISPGTVATATAG